MNREAQDRWNDDGGAIAQDLDIQAERSGCSLSESAALVDNQAREMILDNLEVADQYFAESEHRIARQHCLIAKLRANGPTLPSG